MFGDWSFFIEIATTDHAYNNYMCTIKSSYITFGIAKLLKQSIHGLYLYGLCILLYITLFVG